MKKPEGFDIDQAKNCAKAFSTAVHLGTVVSLADGKMIAAYGDNNCDTCRICALAGQPKALCVHAQIYGMNEAERFGGKYIYFCPMGLTCFASPIVGDDGAEAKITVGPFLMIDRQDYIHDDLLAKMEGDCDLAEINREIDQIPVILAEQVNDMSSLMFMAVGFMNNVWASNNMLDVQESYSIQKQVSSYIAALKGEQKPAPYPFQTESELMDCIAHLDREQANKRLNEIFGYIFFSNGSDVQLAKSRVCELLVLISRTAVTSGADANKMLALSHDYLQVIPRLGSMEDLCMWLSKVMNKFMDHLFEYIDIKHANVIHQAAQYIRTHYAEKITLDSVSQAVYLSPAYFSRVFRQETGSTFNSYLNTFRIEKSKKLLMDSSVRLIDISLMVGFDNQSYFTKVFKRNTGVSPLQYREKKSKSFGQDSHAKEKGGT